MSTRRVAAAALLAGLALLSSPLAWAQADAAGSGLLEFSAEEQQRILRHGPWPPPAAKDAGNRLSGNPQAIALGQQLFFDPRLSGDGNMACATCHIPAKAFTDGQDRAMGRVRLDRNTPSVWNAGHGRWQAWDGAADSLWSQSIRALTDPREMASGPKQVAQAISGDAELSCRWRQLFGTPPDQDAQATLVNAAKALGAFTATLVSGPTSFDRFRDALAKGDKRQAARYPLDAQRGLRLFVGRGQCMVCHVGPQFSNGEFGDTGLPFFIRPGEVDAGRHGGILALRASAYNLLSPWADGGDNRAVPTRHVDLQHRNFGEFKVPGLRNVAETAPYMHAGQLPTLEAVVQYYSNLNVERLHADGEQILKPLNLSAAESADLVAFLKTLSDPRAEGWQPAASKPCVTVAKKR
ncbi:MAG: hypothetical protein IAE92_10160 [Burkholderiaceae bacterium]|nr:hypothetical protein [Burkholderiaceae bacterium]